MRWITGALLSLLFVGNPLQAATIQTQLDSLLRQLSRLEAQFDLINRQADSLRTLMNPLSRDGYITISTQAYLLRDPHAWSTIIGVIPAKRRAEVMGREKDGYWKVQFGGVEGYVHTANIRKPARRDSIGPELGGRAKIRIRDR